MNPYDAPQQSASDSNRRFITVISVLVALVLFLAGVSLFMTLRLRQAQMSAARAEQTARVQMKQAEMAKKVAEKNADAAQKTLQHLKAESEPK